MSRMMQVHGMEGADEGAMGYLSTHPPSRERVQAAEQAAC